MNDYLYQRDFSLANNNTLLYQHQCNTFPLNQNHYYKQSVKTTKYNSPDKRFDSQNISECETSAESEYEHKDSIEFNHEQRLSPKCNDHYAINFQSPNSSAKKQHVQNDQVKYKTEMCRNWEMYGSCNYGTKCRYAHGCEELKEKVNINQFYRTRKCKLYHEQNYCSYGTRCHFIHEMRHHDETYKRPCKLTYQDSLETGFSLGRRLPIFESITSEPQDNKNSNKKTALNYKSYESNQIQEYYH